MKLPGEPLTSDEAAAGLPPDMPADYCPFEKPFAHDFSACGCFRAQRYVAEGLNFVPAAALTTCANILVGRMQGTGSHYAACALGDAEARLRRAGTKLEEPA